MDTIAEATMHGQALSRELEKGYLDSKGRVDYKKIVENAEDMPQRVNLREFREMSI